MPAQRGRCIADGQSHPQDPASAARQVAGVRVLQRRHVGDVDGLDAYVPGKPAAQGHLQQDASRGRVGDRADVLDPDPVLHEAAPADLADRGAPVGRAGEGDAGPGRASVGARRLTTNRYARRAAAMLAACRQSGVTVTVNNDVPGPAAWPVEARTKGPLTPRTCRRSPARVAAR